MIGIAIANSLGLNFLRGIFGPYKSRVEADGGITEAGGCVDAGATPLLQTASLLLIPSGYKANKLYSEIPTNGNGDLTWTRTSTAIRTNSSALLESMGTGIPRLDYTYGSCPSALLEPQRTNIILQSQEFENASWLNNNRTVSANVATAPDGTQTADLIYPTSTGVFRGTYQGGFATGTYNFSVFAKASGKNFVWFFVIGSASANGVWFDLSNGSIGTIGSSWTNVVIQNFGNGWYRCSANVTLTSVSNNLYYLIADANNSNTATTNGTDGILLWGAQLELGAYPTTYIPTTSATATRVADTASKTGISSLIGQTEGVMYWEGRIIQGVPTDLLIIGTTQDSVFFNLTTTPSLRVGVRANNTLVINATSSTLSGTYFKIAVAYKSGDIVAYVNGTQVFTNTQTFTFSGAISEIEIGKSFFDSKATQFNQSTALFPTRLTNSQLASLTTL